MLKLIAGLGNPGAEYAETRHNAGFWLLDRLNDNWTSEKKFFAQCSRVQIAGTVLHLIKPQTFMNRSGQALAAITAYYQIAPEEILIVHDELDLPEGTARLKYGGGHGGHNGLRDIINALGSRDFYRLRIGIGHPGDRQQVINYVLKAPGKAGRSAIEDALYDGERAIATFLRDGSEKAMQQLNTRSR